MAALSYKSAVFRLVYPQNEINCFGDKLLGINSFGEVQSLGYPSSAGESDLQVQNIQAEVTGVFRQI